jgi:hypothetical protein
LTSFRLSRKKLKYVHRKILELPCVLWIVIFEFVEDLQSLDLFLEFRTISSLFSSIVFLSLGERYSGNIVLTSMQFKSDHGTTVFHPLFYDRLHILVSSFTHKMWTANFTKCVNDLCTKVQRLELESSFEDYFYSGYRGIDFFRVLESVTFRMFPVAHALQMPKLCCVQLHPVFTNVDFFHSLDDNYWWFKDLLLESPLIRSFSLCNFRTPLSNIREFLNEWLPELSTLILKNIVICPDHEDSDPIGILKDFYTFGIAARQLLYLQWELCCQFDFSEINRQPSEIFTLSGCFPNLVILQITAEISLSLIRSSVEVLFKTLTSLRMLRFSRLTKLLMCHLSSKFWDDEFVQDGYYSLPVETFYILQITPRWVFEDVIKKKLLPHIQHILCNEYKNCNGKDYVQACKWLQSCKVNTYKQCLLHTLALSNN